MSVEDTKIVEYQETLEIKRSFIQAAEISSVYIMRRFAKYIRR